MSDTITREEMLLNSIANYENSNLTPITREEQYLSYIAGETNTHPVTPITRKEKLLDKIVKNGLGSGGVGVNVQPLNVTENGTYTAPSGIAYSPVNVQVKAESGGDSGGETENRLAKFIGGTLTELTEKDFEGVTTIPANKFSSNKHLVSVTLPGTFNLDGGYIFSNCSSLQTVEFIGKGMTSIGRSTFYNCTNLTSIALPDTVSTIGEYCFESAGIINFRSNKNCLIEQCAFRDCKSLQNVEIQSGCTFAGLNTFLGCTNLTNFEINKDANFYPSYGMFYSCSSLEKFDMPARMNNISSECFKKCSKLSTIVCRYSGRYPVSVMSTSAFEGTPFASGGTGGTVYVPAALIESYKTATNWAALYEAGTCNFVAIEGSEYE